MQTAGKTDKEKMREDTNYQYQEWKRKHHYKPCRHQTYERILWITLYIFDNLDEVKSESCSVVSNSLQLYSPWNPPGQNTGVGSLSFSSGSSQPRDWTQVSRIAGRFFTSWATGKPKNTGVGSLSLLQWIFPTQELN